MPRPELNDDELYEVATYLRRPDVRTEIHAEMPPRRQAYFEGEYQARTAGYPLPAPDRQGPFYIWDAGVNKYGLELRVYFRSVPPVPPVIERLYTDYGKWYARRASYRINYNSLVFQLFDCGFVLGSNPIRGGRIDTFMRNRFPDIR